MLQIKYLKHFFLEKLGIEKFSKVLLLKLLFNH